MRLDHGSHTEDDARRWARAHDDGDDDRLTRADIEGDTGTTSAAERFARNAGWCHDCGDSRTICPTCTGVHCAGLDCMPVGCANEVRRVRAEVARLWGAA